MLLKFFILFLAIQASHYADGDLQTDTFVENGLEPRIIPVNPEQLLALSFANKQCNLGTVYNPQDTQQPPDVDWMTEIDSYYNLAIIGVNDLTPYGATAPILYAMVGNIPGDDNDIEDGDTVASYISPQSAPTTARESATYLAVVYKQQGYVQYAENYNTLITSRNLFNMSSFVAKYKFFYKPTAANIFKVKFIDVPSNVNPTK